MTYRKYAVPALALAVAVAFSPGASARTRTHRTGSAQREEANEHQFANAAWQGNAAEVKLGQLAQQKGCSNDVKQFGQRMVTDHGKANDQLQASVEKDVKLPSKLAAKDQAEYNRLSKLGCPAFDQQYMALMLRDHRHDVAEFKHESAKGLDSKMKTYANNTLPTLEDHLKMAESTMAAVRNGAGKQSASGSYPGASSTAAQGSAARVESPTDRSFLTRAAAGDLEEIEIGNLAKSNSSDQSVKNLAGTLVSDHQKNLDQLKNMTPAGMTLPTTLSRAQQSLKDQLEKLNGAAFDRAFLNAIVRGHNAQIAEYKQEAAHGQNANLKQFAAKTLPSLQQHLNMADSTRAALSKTEPNTAARRKR